MGDVRERGAYRSRRGEEAASTAARAGGSSAPACGARRWGVRVCERPEATWGKSCICGERRACRTRTTKGDSLGLGSDYLGSRAGLGPISRSNQGLVVEQGSVAESGSPVVNAGGTVLLDILNILMWTKYGLKEVEK